MIKNDTQENREYLRLNKTNKKDINCLLNYHKSTKHKHIIHDYKTYLNTFKRKRVIKGKYRWMINYMFSSIIFISSSVKLYNS